MITVNASRREPICLRHQGENDAMRVAFPLSAFEADWPGGTPLLLVQRPRSSRDTEAYPVALSVDGNTAYWTVSASDVEYSGYGKVQLQWRVEDVLVKSCIYDTVCVPSLHAGTEPPDDPSKRWFDAIQAQIGDISKLTTKAKDNLVAAINEAARSGGGSGGAGNIDMRVADGYIQYSNDDGTTWKNLIAIADLKGADGKNGITPTIGENGNWYLGDEDTGKPSRGATGPQGADGANANVTKDAVVGALGFTPIGADDVPVKSVNGANGEVKSTFYVTVTPMENGHATADKTAQEVIAAYAAGYAVYAIVKFAALDVPLGLPLVSAVNMSGTILLGFAALGSMRPIDAPMYPTITYDGRTGKWYAWLGTLARSSDIPTIPTELKNPHPLNIKIGNTTTSYDGSAAKTVEIPEGGGTDESLGITGAAAGKIPKIKAVDAAGKPTAWEATALPNEAFIVYFTQEIQLEGDPILTSDRTPEEVIAAIASKKLVIALLEQDNKVTQLCNIANNGGYLYFFTIGKAGDVVGIGWNIERDMEGGTTYTLTTMAPWNFIGYNGVSGPYQIFGTGELGGYEFKQHIGFENLPAVTTSDNGKFMRVVNGAWKAAEMPESGPTDAQVSSAVNTWLTEHPEATTTVQDGAVTDAKLSDDLYKQVTGNERHTLTEVSVPLIEYGYNSWTMGSGTNNGIAPIKTPKKFRITNPSDTTEVKLIIRFLDVEDPETATISDNQVAREGFYWRVPAGETIEFETLEYGRTTTKYIQMRWTNWPRVLLSITAIYDSYIPPNPVLDTASEYLHDFPMRWTLQPRNADINHETAFCCVPFYPDTTYHVYNPDRIGLHADDVPDAYGLPDETFFAENDNRWAPTSGGLTENIPVHVYKGVAISEKSSDSMIKITTKSWAETMGCKWLAVPCGGQQMRYPITKGSTLTQDTIKEWFDGIQAAGSPISYVSRFNKKIDRHIYSQIVMLNPNLPNDEGTMGMAMALQMPSPLAKSKWMLFGDSLTDAYGGHDLTGKYFASKIAREFGMELDNRAMPGSNIYRGGSGNYVSSSGMIKLDEFVAEIDAGTIEQPDYITIAFGTNSFTAQLGTDADTSETDTTVYGATKRFIEVLREKCPKSVFGFVLSPKQKWGTSDPDNLRDVDGARAAIKTVCEDYGVPYIDMSTQSGITVAMLPDGIHISNDQSQNLYYHAMRRFMMGL